MFANDILLQEVMSIASKFCEAQVLELPYDFADLNLEDLYRQRLDSKKALLITKSTKGIYCRARFEVREAAKLIPFSLPFLDLLVAEKKLSKKAADKLQVAFDEAFANALEHGALELNSNLRTQVQEDGTSVYEALKKSRMQEEKYNARPIWISFNLQSAKFVISVRDAGYGFNEQNISSTFQEIEKPSGRGLMLMRKFTDRLYYNKKGTKVTFVKELVR